MNFEFSDELIQALAASLYPELMEYTTTKGAGNEVIQET